MLSAHYMAFRAWLTGDAWFTGKVDAVVRRNAAGDLVRANYAILTPAIPDRLSDERFTATQRATSSARFTFDVRCVAVDADGALLWAEKTIGRLVGHSLTVAGRSCDPITLVEGVEENAVEYDRVANLYYVDMSFRFHSWEA